MENTCHFVGSRGLLKSCDFHSPEPRSSWAHDYQYLLEMVDGPNMYDGMSVYLCTDVIPFFLKQILPKISHKFFIVSGDSDATVPGGHVDIWDGKSYPLEEALCRALLDSSLLIRWFAQNCILEHPKIQQVPIGLDYHTISADPSKFWRAPHEGYFPRHQEMLLRRVRDSAGSRSHRIFAHLSLTPARQKVLKQIPSELIDVNINAMPRTQIWEEMVRYKFVLSPYGNGLDCHRHWEALCLGCVPIMQSIGSNKMFKNLPALIVNQWSDLTQELLDSFKPGTINLDKLLLNYWVAQFAPPPEDFTQIA